MSRPSLSQLYRQATDQGLGEIDSEAMIALARAPKAASASTVDTLAGSSREALIARLSLATQAWAEDLSAEIAKVGRGADVHTLAPRRNVAWMRPMALAAGVAMMTMGALVITRAPEQADPQGLANEPALPASLNGDAVADQINQIGFDKGNELMSSGFGDTRAKEAPIFGDRFNG